MYVTDHCYTAIHTYDSIYYVFHRSNYALVEFYNHFVTNDLHNFHTLIRQLQIYHGIYVLIEVGKSILSMNSYLTHIE